MDLSVTISDYLVCFQAHCMMSFSPWWVFMKLMLTTGIMYSPSTCSGLTILLHGLLWLPLSKRIGKPTSRRTSLMVFSTSGISISEFSSCLVLLYLILIFFSRQFWNVNRAEDLRTNLYVSSYRVINPSGTYAIKLDVKSRMHVSELCTPLMLYNSSELQQYLHCLASLPIDEQFIPTALSLLSGNPYLTHDCLLVISLFLTYFKVYCTLLMANMVMEMM